MFAEVSHGVIESIAIPVLHSRVQMLLEYAIVSLGLQFLQMMLVLVIASTPRIGCLVEVHRCHGQSERTIQRFVHPIGALIGDSDRFFICPLFEFRPFFNSFGKELPNTLLCLIEVCLFLGLHIDGGIEIRAVCLDEPLKSSMVEVIAGIESLAQSFVSATN